MSRHHFYRPIQDPLGNLGIGAVVTLLDKDGNPLADPIYRADTGTEVWANPWTATEGVIDFYLDRIHKVDINVVMSDNTTQTFVDVQVGEVGVVDRTATEFTLEDPVLAYGQFGLETNTRQLKIGDGTTPWSALDYLKGSPGLNVHSGLGPPDPALGTNGDGYIDFDSGQTFKKAEGVWDFTGSVITGPPGEGEPGPTGQPGRSQFLFDTTGEVSPLINARPMVLSRTSYIEDVVLTSSVAPSATPVIADVLVDGVSLWALNPANRPRLPVGQRVGPIAIPENVGPFDQYSIISGEIVSSGPAGGGVKVPTIDPAQVAVFKTTINAISTFSLPIPSGVGAGDMILWWVVTGSDIAEKPADVTLMRHQIPVGASLHGNLLYKEASSAETAQNVVLTTGSPVVCVAIPLKGVTVVDFEGLASNGQDAITASFASPAFSTTVAGRMGLYFYGTRYATGTGSLHTLDPSLTKIADVVTDRTGTATNFGAGVGFVANMAGGSHPALTASATDGDPARWVSVVGGATPGSGVNTPGEDVAIIVSTREVI